MFTILVILHVIICVFLILVVLLQVGKGMGLSGLMGGGMESILGASGGNTFLKKVTVGFAIGYLISSLLLTIFATRLPVQSIMDNVPIPQAPVESPQQNVPEEQKQQSETKQAQPAQQQAPVQEKK